MVKIKMSKAQNLQTNLQNTLQAKSKIILLLALSLLTVNANAAPITLSGSNFDIIYDSALTGLFGTPILSGNAIFFTPISFKAESLNGNGVVTANSTINLSIIEHNDKNITSLNLLERGDYRLVGNDSVVGIGGQTRAFDLSNPFIESTDAISSASNLTIKNTIVDSSTHNWTSSSFISLVDAKWANTKSFNYTIENLLTAYTEPTATGPKVAFIEKKFAGSSISLIVSTVPEANTNALLLTGLGAIGFIARRRKLG